MSFEEKLKLINTFDRLIRRKVRGNADFYAHRLGLSRSSFFRLLDAMRSEFNIPITYQSEEGCYIYTKPGIMYVGFISAEELTSGCLKKIDGGRYFLKDSKLFCQSQLVGLTTYKFDFNDSLF